MAKSLEGVLVKRAHKKTKYTEEQIQHVAKCADPDSGPLFFMDNFFMIQHPTRGSIRYHPWDYQTRLIGTYHNYRFSISMMPRQTGKSTSAAGYLLWYAMFIPDSTILVAAHKYAGAQEIMQRVRYGYESCPDHIRAGVIGYNKNSLEFDNGSRIVAQTTTENTGRGMSISLLYCDEFAFVRPNIAKEFWTSISPTLTTGGKAIITSTPNSDEDQFALIWKLANKCEDEYGNVSKIGTNGFRAFRSYWKEHPERDEEWAVTERNNLGEERFRREHECEFIINDETLISSIKLLDLQGTDPHEVTGQVRWYEKPKKDTLYAVGWDPSLGTGGDPAAIQVFNAKTLTQVAEWKHNKTTIPRQVKVFTQIIDRLAEESGDINQVYYSVENNTIGEAAIMSIAEYGEDNIPGIFLSETKRASGSRVFRRGFNTTHQSKLSSCAKLKNLVESGRLTIKSKALVTELKAFVAYGTSFSAKPGETDDLVMALVLVIRMLQQLKDFDRGLSENMTDHEDAIQEPMPFILF